MSAERYQPHEPARFRVNALDVHWSVLLGMMPPTAAEIAWRSVLDGHPNAQPCASPRPASNVARALGCTCVQINGGVPSARWEIGWKGGVTFNLGWAIAHDCVLHGALLDEVRS